MATNSKQARRDAENKRQNYRIVYDNYFENLFHNSVEVVDLPEELPKRYLLKTLYRRGGIAYDKELNLYLPFNAEGVDLYGLPTMYTLVGYNGFVVRRSPADVVILRANDLRQPIKEFCDIQAEKIVNIDMAIEQNLEAIKTMTIVSVADRPTLLTLGNIAESRQIGASMVFINKSAIQGSEISVQPTGATYLVDKLQNAREKVFNEALQHLGISTVNTAKAERVQTEEITTAQGQAIENINTVIDTFNHDAEKGGLSIRLKANTALIEDRELLKKEGNNNEQ